MLIKKLTVDGKIYEVTPFTPREAIALEVRIESLFGAVLPSLKNVLASGEKEVMAAIYGALPELASSAIAVVAKLDPELGLLFDVLKKTSYQAGNGVSFALDSDDAIATVFTGNHLGLFTLAWEVLKVNGFFITKTTGLLSKLTSSLAVPLPSTEPLPQALSENG